MSPQPTGGHTVILVDDSRLFREGLSALLTAAGLHVAAELSSSDGLPSAITAHRPSAVVLDARMPPTHTDEGIRAALQIRRDHPYIGALVLSTYADGAWAKDLFAAGSSGIGYLLKDRVDDVTSLVGAINRVASGGTAVDSEVVEQLINATNRRESPLSHLAPRELEVLNLMAQGRSNAGIGRALFLSPRTVEAYVASLFTKLPLDQADASTNRRVLAVLAYLQHTAG